MRVLIVERHLVFYNVNESQQIVTIYAVVDGRRESQNYYNQKTELPLYLR